MKNFFETFTKYWVFNGIFLRFKINILTFLAATIFPIFLQRDSHFYGINKIKLDKCTYNSFIRFPHFSI